jgi:hypothetical protein
MRMNVNSFLTEQRHLDDLLNLLLRAASEISKRHFEASS